MAEERGYWNREERLRRYRCLSTPDAGCRSNCTCDEQLEELSRANAVRKTAGKRLHSNSQGEEK